MDYKYKVQHITSNLCHYFLSNFVSKKSTQREKHTHTQNSQPLHWRWWFHHLCTFRISCGSTGITQGQAVPFIEWWIPSGHWITFSQKFFIIHGSNQWTIVFTWVGVGLFGFVDGEKKLTQKTQNPQKTSGKKSNITHWALRGWRLSVVCDFQNIPFLKNIKHWAMFEGDVFYGEKRFGAEVWWKKSDYYFWGRKTCYCEMKIKLVELKWK